MIVYGRLARDVCTIEWFVAWAKKTLAIADDILAKGRAPNTDWW